MNTEAGQKIAAPQALGTDWSYGLRYLSHFAVSTLCLAGFCAATIVIHKLGTLVSARVQSRGVGTMFKWLEYWLVCVGIFLFIGIGMRVTFDLLKLIWNGLS